MHALLAGISNDTCTNCTDLNGVAIDSNPIASGCDWLWTGVMGSGCGRLAEAAWSVGVVSGQCRRALDVLIGDYLLLRFWEDASEPPDCWARKVLPLKQTIVYPHDPSSPICQAPGATATVWGTDV
jgi:hypothetical protein